MTLDDVDLRIGYFHGASDEFLHQLGVDRDLLPDPASWKDQYRIEFELPVEERSSYGVMREHNGSVVGWSTADQFVVGVSAFMHLHLIEAENRARGLGVEFVKLTVEHLFELLDIVKLFSEPNALNVAANRTLQRAGFRYLFSHRSEPGAINFEQVTTRWVVDRSVA
jgi:RimJ/RimL family protein N-acetyltransferase